MWCIRLLKYFLFFLYINIDVVLEVYEINKEIGVFDIVILVWICGMYLIGIFIWYFFLKYGYFIFVDI